MDVNNNNNSFLTKKSNSIIPINHSKSTQTFKNGSDTSKTSIHWPLKAKMVEIFTRNIYCYSIATASIFHLMFLTIYPAALIQGQVEPILPWISDTGSVGPQAAFFSQFIDSLCVLMSFIVYARYRQLEYYIHVKLPKVNPSISVEHLQRLDKVNFIALVVFVCSACLLMIPGNFRSTEWLLVHASMAVAGFTATYLYATLLVYLSNEMAKEGLESRPLTMAVITFTGILALIVLVICGLISVSQFVMIRAHQFYHL